MKIFKGKKIICKNSYWGLIKNKTYTILDIENIGNIVEVTIDCVVLTMDGVDIYMKRSEEEILEDFYSDKEIRELKLQNLKNV